MTATLLNLGLPFAILALVLRSLWRSLQRYLAIGALVLVLLVLVGSLPRAGVPRSRDASDDPTAIAVEPSARAIPVPWADAVPRWPGRARCPAAAAPQASLATLQARAVDELHALRSAISQGRGVTAIVRAENVSGSCLDFVATQANLNVEHPPRCTRRSTTRSVGSACCTSKPR